MPGSRLRAEGSHTDKAWGVFLRQPSPPHQGSYSPPHHPSQHTLPPGCVTRPPALGA